MTANGTGEMDALMNAEETARYLHVETQTVYRMAARGELPCYRLGRRLRFRREAIDAYLEELQHPATPKGAPHRVLAK